MFLLEVISFGSENDDLDELRGLFEPITMELDFPGKYSFHCAALFGTKYRLIWSAI